MRVGCIGFATDQGIGHLAKSFYDAGVLTDMLVLRHGRRVDHPEWYGNPVVVGDLKRDAGILRNFCTGKDVMMFFETPFDWELIPFCRSVGVNTAIMPMYECMPKSVPYTPDLWLCPSLLDVQYYPGSPFVEVPVDPILWTQRTKAERFLHNSGHIGLMEHKGTVEILKAIRFISSQAKVTIRSQEPSLRGMAKDILGSDLDRVTLEVGNFPRESLFHGHDVFLMAEKYNGLSLPLREARASGMLVMTSDRFPMNTWLPKEPLIKVSSTRVSGVSPRCNDFEESLIDPRDIAAKIDEMYGQDITSYSQEGREWAKTMSWEVLKPQYLSVLEELCNAR